MSDAKAAAGAAGSPRGAGRIDPCDCPQRRSTHLGAVLAVAAAASLCALTTVFVSPPSAAGTHSPQRELRLAKEVPARPASAGI